MTLTIQMHMVYENNIGSKEAVLKIFEYTICSFQSYSSQQFFISQESINHHAIFHYPFGSNIHLIYVRSLFTEKGPSPNKAPRENILCFKRIFCPLMLVSSRGQLEHEITIFECCNYLASALGLPVVQTTIMNKLLDKKSQIR